MAQPTPMDEYFVHQIPELLSSVAVRNDFWRESYFFELHDPDGRGDVVFFTMARYPSRKIMDSIQMGRVAGRRFGSLLSESYGDDPHTSELPGARVEVVRPFEELRIWSDQSACAIGVDLTFRARTRPYALRRGTMRAGDDVVWDQSHILQSGHYSGTYSVGDLTREVDGWVGQRDHSWGIRDHGRCPLWMWLQIQLEDGFLGVWHWELANGARIYTDGCWAAADGSDPVPVVAFDHDMEWTGVDGGTARYGEHGETVEGLRGTTTFTLAGGGRITVEAEGNFAQPYEPFHRGGLSQMSVRTDDGRRGTAIYEVTGARHHHWFPDTVVDGVLPW
ncbi:MAG: hypothetical protein ACLQNG_15140 [Acidimicrobiales bacterium]|jgi:hypothetical protein